ncbi:MAG: GNAT family N-acetyltransferase [Chitinophagales bacterium]|nr:GNAT family N-acetyltransferase [Chitinophagales bacterium]
MILNLERDIYFQKAYAALYAAVDSGAFADEFEYVIGNYSFKHIGIKRKISEISGKAIQGNVFDMQTPYGYGGMLSNTGDTIFVSKAFEAYRAHCANEHIAAAFYTFHPFLPYFEEMKSQFNFLRKDREVVIVPLQASREERWAGYASNTRNILRNCTKQLTYSLSEDLQAFKALYYQTMEKNKATSFYYFDDAYFEGLLNLDDCSLVSVNYEGKAISMAFLFHSDVLGHYHLSANDSTYSKLNGNYFLLEESIEFLKSKQLNYFMLGGGRTNAEDDSLYKFKRKFSSMTLPYYIGGIIFDEEKYIELCNLWQVNNPSIGNNYFLKYRF